MTTREAVIVAAKRTPVGRAKRGSLVYTRPEAKPLIATYNDGIVLQTDKGIEAFKAIAGFVLPSTQNLITRKRSI